ncbi:MAG: hypothetical protein C5B53_01990 [Candidatus Melainabacteria bacterium]|nr:MAG: hypothetical protein C5B53_01990 [Candidatus Melainabacteria bacterium]
MRQNILKSDATKQKRQFNLIVCQVIAMAFLTCTSVQATPRGADWFSINSAGSAPQSAATASQNPAKVQVNTDAATAAQWFRQFDKLVAQYRPSPADRVILNRPLMQEEERVKQWTATASKISRNYTQLAKSLKQIPIPSQLSDLKEYRDLTIDWYHDAALVFDDMIRPRTPANTIEELQRQLEQVKSRSENLSSTLPNLIAMDRDLRKRYKVAHNSDQTDDKLPQNLHQASK